ncbi:MAG TPA: FAD-binding oxidoreductase [Paenirhodobacter sp.]
MIDHEDPLIADSLWTATANPPPAAPPLQGAEDTAVAIVGGGITGLSAALHLRQRGIAATVIEAQSIGWGASGRNGGQLNPGLKSDPDTIEATFGAEMGKRMIAATGGGADYTMQLIREHDIACDAVQPGWIVAAHNPVTLAATRERARQWAARGADVQPLSRDQIGAMVGADVYTGGLIDRRGANLHPLNYTYGLAEAALRHGAVLHGASPVTTLARQGAGYVLTTPTGTLRAGKVLICTNGYTDGLVPPLARTLVPVRSIQVATEPLSGAMRRTILPERQAVSDSRRVMVYYKLDGAGRLLMGGRGDYDRHTTAALLENLRRVTRKMYPQLQGIRFEHAWGGFVAMTADHYPHLTTLGPGVLSATGYNGRGVALATVMGRIMADWADGVPPEALDFPMTPAQPIPFHFLRKPAVKAAICLFRLQDALGI